MDPFTQKILEQARERQKLLKGYSYDENKDKTEDKNVEETSTCDLRKSSNSNKSPFKNSDRNDEQENSTSPSKSKVFNIQKDNISMEIKVTSSDNIRMQIDFEEESDTETPKSPNNKNNVDNKSAGLRKDCKERLNRLGQLYAGGDDANLSSPIHRTEEKFSADLAKTYAKEESVPKKLGGKGLKALADLAQKINHLEDDIKPKDDAERSDKMRKPSHKPPAPKPPRPSMIPECPVRDKISRLNNGLQASNKKQMAPPIPGKQIALASPKKVIATASPKKVIAPASPKKQFAPASPRATPASPKNQSASKQTYESSITKTLKWDNSVLNSLESQGFQRKAGDIVYDYSAKGRENTQNSKELKENQIYKKCSSAISDKASRFESPQSKNTPDPSSLSLSERKALFERNKGEALIPKAPFSMSIPIKDSKPGPKPVHPIKPTNSIVQEKVEKSVNKKVCPKTTDKAADSPTKPAVPQASGIASTLAALMQNKQTISQSQIESEIKQQRNKELDMLNNRFNKRKEQPKTIIEEDETQENTPLMENREDFDSSIEDPRSRSPIQCRRSSGSKRPSVSPKVVAVLEDVKRIKVSPSKPGRLYPSLSDIDATTETESDRTQSPTPNNSSIESYSEEDNNTSFGRELLEFVKTQTPQKRVISDESNSDASDVLDDMDEYLEEALTENNLGPTPPKQNKSRDYSYISNSFNYKDFSPNVSKQTRSPVKTMVSGDKSTHEDSEVPLTHTVSFYRKQTKTPTASPMKQVTRKIADDVCSKEDDRSVILEKIKSLQDEVNKQQLIIAQTSQALNLCNSTLEFMGSTEQVEAEKVLLLSTHRRQAILNEIQRLKVEGTLRPQNTHAEDIPVEKGVLKISNIKFQLKKEYVRALAAAGGKGHHVTCLVKSNEEVVCSKLVSTVASTIKNPCYDLLIPDTITLKNIYSDFAVTFEIYCLQAQEELIPHELKYHIKKSSKATPKKSKHDSLLSRPVKESPGGPNAVRSPSFALMGYVVFSIRQINKKTWTLNNTPAMSPLDGTVEMSISCEFTASEEYRGFLTMFEDISGFGAWHRRWCLLKGDSLSYWKYPDDERKQPPIDTIDLKCCITKEVGPVSRDICARLNTLLIECEREALPQDKDSLVVICKGDKTIIRYLLSADTKEERKMWCAKFNSSLTALRLWRRT